MLFNSPRIHRAETVNDYDGFVANFWRAVQAAPDKVAKFADWPVNENDLHARHSWLVSRKADLQSRLEGDPDYFDPKIAGWWVWGICCWIGSGFCSGKGPWNVVEENGHKVLRNTGTAGQGVNRQLPHLGDAGRGVNRKLPHLIDYMQDLADRLRRVRVCCGDWERVCGPTPTVHNGLTAVFLDPPYSAEAGRDNVLYRQESLTVAHRVREWCIENGNDKRLRIALCGYEGEHKLPRCWTCVAWKAQGGMANTGNARGKENAHRERIWFSPGCVKVREQKHLFQAA